MDEEIKFSTLSKDIQQKIYVITERFLKNKRIRKKNKCPGGVQSEIQKKLNILVDFDDCRKLYLRTKKIKNLKRQKRTIQRYDFDDKTKNIFLREWNEKIKIVESTIGYSKIIRNSMHLEDVKKHLERQYELERIKAMFAKRIQQLDEKLDCNDYISSGESQTLKVQLDLIKGYSNIIQTELNNNASLYQTLSCLISADMIDADGKEKTEQEKQQLDSSELKCFDIMADIFTKEDTSENTIKDAIQTTSNENEENTDINSQNNNQNENK